MLFTKAAREAARPSPGVIGRSLPAGRAAASSPSTRAIHGTSNSEEPQRRRPTDNALGAFKGQAGRQVHTFGEGQNAWAKSLRGGGHREGRRRRSKGLDIDGLVFANLFERGARGNGLDLAGLERAAPDGSGVVNLPLREMLKLRERMRTMADTLEQVTVLQPMLVPP